MNIITDCIRLDKEYTELLGALDTQRKAKKLPIYASGLTGGAAFAFIASLCRDVKSRYGCTPLVFVGSEKEALRTTTALNSCGLSAYNFVSRDLNFYNITASHEFEHERLNVLSAILEGTPDAIVTTPDAALRYTIPPERLKASYTKISYDLPCKLDELAAALIQAGYVRVDMVNGIGQFSFRGGIVDIYPPNAHFVMQDGTELSGSHPVRIELFGDDVDRMGTFDIFTQRLVDNVDSVIIPPAREILVTNDVKSAIRDIIETKQKSTKSKSAKNTLSGELAAIDGGLELNFIDKYLSVVYPERTCLLDYFTSAVAIIRESNAIKDRLAALEWRTKEEIEDLTLSGTIDPKYADYTADAVTLDGFFEKNTAIHCNSFSSGISGAKMGGLFGFSAKQTVSYGINYSLLCEDIETYVKNAYRMVLLCESDAEAKNLLSMLLDSGYNAIIENKGKGESYSPETLPRGCILIRAGENFPGFELPLARFAVLSTLDDKSREKNVKYSNSKKKKIKSKDEQKILSYADLEVGDYVVHVAHGIGQYMGIEKLTVDGVTRDYINIRYAGSDKLFLPVNQLDLVSKYIGAHSDDGTLKLSKFGGTEWTKAKSRAKAAVKDMAKELIKLYAERLRRGGYAFPADDNVQHDFEEAFEYDETEGQLAAIADIKQDMMNSSPMDRLLCGDVGYGKTEVALRAAFKAILAGKQVAILVPTTILAMQHFQTALSRMRSFPVTVDMVSRFRTPKQQAEILRRLRRGEVDLIIGTHRLISGDVQFKNLGLLIIDEEQRFGVAQKEKIKQYTENIDVLTLSATPIPRTLNMAMGGIRDISILDEAPGARLPVQTYVLEHDELIINEAIKKELSRGGQVFYMHNNVESIDLVAYKLKVAFPDAKIAVGHGKMDKEQLEDIWHSLIVGDTDILVCTTIIETGVDVPNANTLIVDNADRLGLSQLHQIRGRVGRSSRKAYAYFTYPRGKSISEIATKRLSALREYAEFGAGFKIALRDLEIRGAGNILGAEQHGHMDTVGYDLYIKLLNEAVLEEKGEKIVVKPECTVDVNFDAYIPDEYIGSASQRMDMYKKIALIENGLDFSDIEDELCDRFGDIPEATMNLLKIALLRSYGRECEIKKIEYRGRDALIVPTKINIDIWSEITAAFDNRVRINMSSSPSFTVKLKKTDHPLDLLIDMFKKHIELSSKK